MAITGLIAILPVVSYAVDSLTGTYVAGGGPREVRFLALTQSASALSASLTTITPDEGGGIKLQKQDLVGNADVSSITLNSEALHLNGSRNGQVLLLSASSTTGPRVTYRFVAMDDEVFKRTLANWRLTFAAQTSERNQLTALSKQLTSDIDKIQNTGIPSDISSMERDVNNQRTVVRQMAEDLDDMKRDAAVRPVSCHQTVQTVGHAYAQTLSQDFRLARLYSGSQYLSAKKRLKLRLANAPALIDKAMKDAIALQQAMRVSKYHLQVSGITPEDATAKVAAYYTLTTDAQSRLLRLQSQVERAMEQAKELLADGKATVRKVESCVASRN
jgi:hypothetical protein